MKKEKGLRSAPVSHFTVPPDGNQIQTPLFHGIINSTNEVAKKSYEISTNSDDEDD